MKIRVKQVISIMLIISFLAGFLPANVMAATNNAELDSSNYSVEGTGSFGNMLASELQGQVEEQNGDYNISNLVMEGNVAKVSYKSIQDAVVVVAIYEEETDKMLGSGKVNVTSGELEAEVLVDIDTMPEYFLVSAYLVNRTTMQPLCAEYTTQIYSQAYEKFMELEVDDFAGYNVLNLDEDNSNNFAVYNESVLVFEEQVNTNVLVSVDNENRVYGFENVDSTISSLKEGDVFAYQTMKGDTIIVKVASVTVNRTSATIVGNETTVEDVFAYVKIDVKSDIDDFVEVNEENVPEEAEVYALSTTSGELEEGVKNIDIPLKDMYDLAERYEKMKEDMGETGEDNGEEEDDLLIEGSFELTELGMDYKYYYTTKLFGICRMMKYIENDITISWELNILSEKNFLKEFRW